MLIEKIKERFAADILESLSEHGEETIVLGRDRLAEVMGALRDEADFRFEFLIDVTGVDRIGRKPRFDVVYHLKSISKAHRLRVKVMIDEDDAWVPSMTALWKSADWLERECYDMFGFDFRGHDDLRRVLLYDSFKGHPLRKDFHVMERHPIVPEIDPIVNPLKPSR